jgi:hypothetical protein
VLWFAITSAETLDESGAWQSRPEYDYRPETASRLWRVGTRVRVERTYIRIYIRTGGTSIRTRPLDCNDGAARRVVPEKGPDPKLRNESLRQVSPSQVRDACGPHDGNEHIRRAIASEMASPTHALHLTALALGQIAKKSNSFHLSNLNIARDATLRPDV